MVSPRCAALHSTDTARASAVWREGSRRYKRWVGAFLLILGSFVMSGCSPASLSEAENSRGSTDSRPLVLTTFTVLADMARNVAGEHLRVESITKVGAEIHGYDPTPQDLTVAADASLILDNGFGLELWFSKFVADLDVPHAVLTEGIEPVLIGEGAAGGQINPHAWMSPKNAEIYIQNIAQAFIALDPSHADDYRVNAEAYHQQIMAEGERLVRVTRAVPEQSRALVTCEGAFSYLAEDAGLTEKYLWPVNAESEPTPTTVGEVIDFVRENNVPSVFCESTVSDKMMRQVAQESNAAYGGTLYVDSLSEPDGPVPTYLDLISYNVDLITAGLIRGTESS
ncbi:metal ABC transporter substrate-binding protein [Lysinibacter sp. HNR]|uniref:metal ABC transporter substrate-binding protein n=1 Tax=Lysinibacter sp. HNR TaxID=3031408 RepID=UPI002434ABD4|nr:metal ABC transporter substrate-binding protein [Lysinibacter sp. HNR]WGD38451.1 metal ABC transporter substrate-binding protein [Lysinibacter sp. HNR]